MVLFHLENYWGDIYAPNVHRAIRHAVLRHRRISPISACVLSFCPAFYVRQRWKSSKPSTSLCYHVSQAYKVNGANQNATWPRLMKFMNICDMSIAEHPFHDSAENLWQLYTWFWQYECPWRSLHVFGFQRCSSSIDGLYCNSDASIQCSATTTLARMDLYSAHIIDPLK